MAEGEISLKALSCLRGKAGEVRSWAAGGYSNPQEKTHLRVCSSKKTFPDYEGKGM